MLAGNWLVGLPPEYLGEYVPKIREVNAAQVQAMARKYYDPEDQSIAVVGDAAAVADKINPYGAIVVREKSRIRAAASCPARGIATRQEPTAHGTGSEIRRASRRARRFPTVAISVAAS